MATRKYHRKTNKFRKTKRKNRKSKKTSKRFSNKRVRKIRSKRQRGGNDEMNKYFFDAIVIDDAGKAEAALKVGADVNMTDRLRIGLKVGNTALMEACTYKYREIVEMLLKQDGIEVNATNDNGDTALMKAINCEEEVDYDIWTNVEEDIKKIVAMLLDAGAKVNMVNNNNKTALDIAKETECTEIIQLPLKQLIQRNKEKQTLNEMAIGQLSAKPKERKDYAKQLVFGQLGRNKTGEINGLTGTTGIIGSFIGGKKKNQ